MSQDLKGLSTRVVENALKVIIPSSGDRIEGIAGLVDSFRQFRSSARTRSAVVARLNEAAEAIAERMESYVEREFLRLDEADRRLAIEGVLRAMDGLDSPDGQIPLEDLSSERLIELCRPLAEADWDRTLLAEDAREYGRLYLAHACDYIVAIAQGMPDFSARVQWETYQLVRRLEEALSDSISSVVPPVTVAEAHEFGSVEASHRSQVAVRYNSIDLFGLGLPSEMRRQPISVAYVHLRASAPPEAYVEETPAIELAGHGRFGAGPARGSLPMDEALRHAFRHNRKVHTFDDEYGRRVYTYQGNGARALLVGSAGSGKTTISQWLAVRTAIRKLPAGLQQRIGPAVPFFVSLRNAFRRTTTPTIDVLMNGHHHDPNSLHRRWLVEVLEAGDGLVILDGFDELSEASRAAAEAWLDHLLTSYPESHFFATSRPEGLRHQWFHSRDFRRIELQMMEAAQARECIRNWYAALIESGPPEKRRDFLSYQESLLADFATRPAVSDLAQTPLLCAMLCALYATDTPESVPQSRMELYGRVVEALVDRRDRERLLRYEGMPDFTGREKLQLLQAIARQMTETSQTIMPIWRPRAADAKVPAAIDAVERRLASMPTTAVTGGEALGHLVERSVVFRDVGGGDGQFAHRTFQEYLAGRDYAYVGDVDELLARSGDLTLRNTIVFAAGAGDQRLASRLVEGLAEMAGTGPNRRDTLLLLAECAGAAGPLEPAVVDLARDAVAEVMPPRTLAEAETVAALGDHVIAWLHTYNGSDPEIQRACVHAAIRVGTPRAMTALGGFSRLPLPADVVGLLMKAWTRFEPMSYAQQVITNLDLQSHPVTVSSLGMLQAVATVEPLRHLRIDVPVDDFRDLGSLPNLESLQASGVVRDSAAGLHRFTSLHRLDLSSNTRITDVPEVARLAGLRQLSLDRCASVTDLSPLRRLARLRVLSLNGLGRVGDWGWLDELQDLWTLSVDGCDRFDPEALTPLKELRSLFANIPDGVTTTSPLLGCEKLRRVHLRLRRDMDPDQLVLPSGVRSVEIRGQVTPAVIQQLAKLPRLSRLVIVDVTGLTDAAPLAVLPGLRELGMREMRDVDEWDDLARLTGLRKLDLSGSGVRNLDFARTMPNLEHVVADRCGQLLDIDGLAGLPILKSVSLRESLGGSLAGSVDFVQDRSANARQLQIEYIPALSDDYAVS